MRQLVKLTKFRIVISAFTLLSLILIGMAIHARLPKPIYPLPRHIEYSFTLQNVTNRVVQQAEFWTYAPIAQNSSQRFEKLAASYPYELLCDDQGNQIVHFSFADFPPFAAKIITINADLMLTDVPNRVALKNRAVYLKPEKYCECDAPEIVALAKTLRGRSDMETAKNTLRWVGDNLQYGGYAKNPGGALMGLCNKKGDCTEFMYLFVALCRANHIPARGMGGYVAEENAVLTPAGYHNWAECYVEGAWRLADPQRKVFGEYPSRYIALRVIGDAVNNPMGDYNRFRCTGEGLEAEMNG